MGTLQLPPPPHRDGGEERERAAFYRTIELYVATGKNVVCTSVILILSSIKNKNLNESIFGRPYKVSSFGDLSLFSICLHICN